VAFSSRKELEFFDLYDDRGLDWYLAQLPLDPGSRVVVEATPSYLSDGHAPGRIAATLPTSRFVVVLREPVARAWSQCWFFVQLGIEERPWDQALHEEQEGSGPGYFWRSRYGAQIARWDSLMGRDRTLVMLLDEMSAAPMRHSARCAPSPGFPLFPHCLPSPSTPPGCPALPASST
jgi:hypothetical protein